MIHLSWDNASAPLILIHWILGTIFVFQLFKLVIPLRSYLHDSCQLYIIGLFFGIIFDVFFQWNIYLFPALFFLYLLPPIALDAGYFMPKKAFFDYVGTILLYAVIGTMINTVIIGAILYLFSSFYKAEIDPLSLLLFATLISPTDPVSVLSVFEELHVNEQLYILVSGESLLNDAFGIVLYNSLSSMAAKGANNVVYFDAIKALLSFATVGIGAIVLGALFAALTAIWTKISSLPRTFPLIVLLLPYLCYLLAEKVHLSGMLAIVSCGLWMCKYVGGNLDSVSLITTENIMKTWASSSDAIIFSFLGISTISSYHNWDWVFIVVTVGAILLARFFAIFLLTFIVNKFKTEQVSWKHQLVLAYSGIRGPICYGLVQSLDVNYVQGKDVMVTTSIVVILVTCLLQGITIKPFLTLLNIEKEAGEIDPEQRNELPTAASNETTRMGSIWRSWQEQCLTFNSKYIEPLLLVKRDQPRTQVKDHDSPLSLHDITTATPSPIN